MNIRVFLASLWYLFNTDLQLHGVIIEIKRMILPTPVGILRFQ